MEQTKLNSKKIISFSSTQVDSSSKSRNYSWLIAKMVEEEEEE